LAGSTVGYLDGTGTGARFNNPYGVAVDSAGTVYVVDTVNNRIRKITPAGVVTALAGSVYGYLDGTGTGARFSYPYGVAVDSAGTVYVADSENNRIRKITPAGVVTTLAGSTDGYLDGTGTGAQFSYPCGVAVDSAGTVYVGDWNNNRIRKITPAGVVTTLAGSTVGYLDGTGTGARFNNPYGVAVDSAGTVYVADSNNNRIRKITPAGVVTTLAGSTVGYLDGTGTGAQFNNPCGVAVDSAGTVYVGDSNNFRIRKVTTT
jgi:sugar lactone lactonase YvrE